MKKFAIFLPQFHEIPENNEWWGDGFTEWTNVKKGTPLYKGHIQPKKPLNDNYYNLLNKETVLWQTDLLNKYKIDGMVYYHYYFNGKKLLEKPAENLLKWKEIPQHFFFCWANHSWVRSWNGTRSMLVEQTYGTEKDWEKHFQYLLAFFKDDRYEKIENQPMLMLFKSSFAEKEPMFCYFDKRCKEEGFDGLYLIESYHGDMDYREFEDELSSVTKLIYFREPAVALSLYYSGRNLPQRVIHRAEKILRGKNLIARPDIINGANLIDIKINHEPMGENIGHGIWFEWDNTPRHKQRGYVITPYPKCDFFRYMDAIKNENMLFINAWNEWAEGMTLEPTVENGYKYLEWIKEWADKNGKQDS